MRKLTKSTLSLMLVLCMFLLSFTACSTPDREDPLVGKPDMNVFSFDAKSLEELNEMFSNGEIEPKHENDIFERAINNENLSFDKDKYYIRQIKYMPIQNGDYEFTGDVVLSILWYTRYYDEALHEFDWFLCYYKDGSHGLAKDFSQVDGSKLYIREGVLNYTEYVYLINDNYRCEYTIENDMVDKEEISNQLLEICRDIEAMLQE